MSKILTFTIIILGTLLLLNIIGYNPPATGLVYKLISNSTQTDTGKLVDYNQTDSRLSNVENYDFWQKLKDILLGLGLVGIVVSFFVRTPPIEYIVSPLVVLIGTALLVDLVWLFGEFWGFGMPYNMIGMLIFAPLIAALIISLIEWWRFGT